MHKYCIYHSKYYTLYVHLKELNKIFCFSMYLFIVGFSQGIRRFSGGLGNLLAPLWAGGLVNNLSVLIGVLLAMITLATVSKLSLSLC